MKPSQVKKNCQVQSFRDLYKLYNIDIKFMLIRPHMKKLCFFRKTTSTAVVLPLLVESHQPIVIDITAGSKTTGSYGRWQ